MTLKTKWSISFFLTLSVLLILQFQGAALKTEISPQGIVDLEFAGTITRLEQLISRWDFSTVQLNILLDFLFIPSFTFFFIISIKILINSLDFKLIEKIGKTLIKFAFVAALFDVLEDILMLFSIYGMNLKTSLPLTPYVAGIKFLIIAVILSFLIVCLILWLFVFLFKKNISG